MDLTFFCKHSQANGRMMGGRGYRAFPEGMRSDLE